ncbi:uncharacterized protein EV420DRAFT_702366 [Desarmillaria tabescens]|uniref:Uncharacterized protein n=1 Tax=Armillaria tabescens TaxID=1929756 RepID=A0AA39MZP4_ARMTA|nr:uncharacterized protein EV420DRAFT_702366 [Desarmillaria tabescens]KAK0451999.1 hypothetical protein EV420DRAFT_702366 [Desarmillaria tabescens]
MPALFPNESGSTHYRPPQLSTHHQSSDHFLTHKYAQFLKKKTPSNRRWNIGIGGKLSTHLGIMSFLLSITLSRCWESACYFHRWGVQIGAVGCVKRCWNGGCRWVARCWISHWAFLLPLFLFNSEFWSVEQVIHHSWSSAQASSVPNGSGSKNLGTLILSPCLDLGVPTVFSGWSRHRGGDYFFDVKPFYYRRPVCLGLCSVCFNGIVPSLAIPMSPNALSTPTHLRLLFTNKKDLYSVLLTWVIAAIFVASVVISAIHYPRLCLLGSATVAHGILNIFYGYHGGRNAMSYSETALHLTVFKRCRSWLRSVFIRGMSRFRCLTYLDVLDREQAW